MPKHKDFSKYVKITSDCNVAVRGSVDEPWPDERERPGWVNSGWSPEMARELADAIRDAADEAEKRDRLPEYWPPRIGDLWRLATTEDRFLVIRYSAVRDQYRLINVQRGIEEVANANYLLHNGFSLVYREGVKP